MLSNSRAEALFTMAKKKKKGNATIKDK